MKKNLVIPYSLMENLSLLPAEKLIIAIIIDMEKNYGYTKIKRTELANAVGISYSTIRRLVDGLKLKNILKRASNNLVEIDYNNFDIVDNEWFNSAQNERFSQEKSAQNERFSNLETEKSAQNERFSNEETVKNDQNEHFRQEKSAQNERFSKSTFSKSAQNERFFLKKFSKSAHNEQCIEHIGLSTKYFLSKSNYIYNYYNSFEIQKKYFANKKIIIPNHPQKNSMVKKIQGDSPEKSLDKKTKFDIFEVPEAFATFPNSKSGKKLNQADSQEKSKKTKKPSGTSEENQVDPKEIITIIKAFEQINPIAKNWYSYKTVRTVAEKIIKTFGLKETLHMINNVIPKTNSQPYAPVITNLKELYGKWAKLELFLRKQEQDKKSSKHYQEETPKSSTVKTTVL